MTSSKFPKRRYLVPTISQLRQNVLFPMLLLVNSYCSKFLLYFLFYYHSFYILYTKQINGSLEKLRTYLETVRFGILSFNLYLTYLYGNLEFRNIMIIIILMVYGG